MSEAQQPFNALPLGHRLQEYELVRVLGVGDFDIMYLGTDHNLKKAVAIKEYLPSDIATRTTNHSVVPQADDVRGDFQWGLGRFLDEASILARFDHRHIIKVHRFFEAYGTAYIVMEYAEGETLSAYLERKGTLSEAELKEILYPLLDGLAVVHGANLLHRDINPDNIVIRAEDGSPVLLNFDAARWNASKAAEVLLRSGAAVDAPKSDGSTPLHDAARWNASATAEVLLKHGADVQAKGSSGATPLHYAAVENAEVSLRERAAREAASFYVHMPHIAASVNTSVMAGVLLCSGAAVNAKNDAGETPLHIAASEDAPEMAELLLRAGAAVDAKDKDGETPLHVMAKWQLSTYRQLRASYHYEKAKRVLWAAYETGKELLCTGAAVDAKNNAGETPLHVAARRDNSWEAKDLLSNGADVHARNDAGETPLHVAAEYDASSTAEVLLRQGAAVNVRDSFGYTPLYVAMEYNASATASVLRRYGGRE